MMHVIFIVSILLLNIPLNATGVHNLFEAYNILILPYRPPRCAWQFGLAYEGAFSTKAFLSNDVCQPRPSASSCGNVLQLWQRDQNAIAALSGSSFDTPAGQLVQELLFDNNQGIYTPFAKLHVPANIALQMRIRLPYQMTLGCYIPYRVFELSDVRWCQINPLNTFDQIISPDFINVLEQLNGTSLRGWQRSGFGDLLTRVELYRTFPQAKPWLQMVGLSVRAGVLWPTGKEGNPDILFGFPLGNGGGIGMHVSGMLEVCYRHGIVFGIDAELLHLFGRSGCFRVKTDSSQTDLFLPTKVRAFLEPGFTQRFTIFGEKVQAGGGFAGTLAYQYGKRSEDILYPCVNEFDTFVINDAESLQEWTAHSLIFMLSYDWSYKQCWDVVPSCSFFVKAGFNGKRSILANTVGFTVSCAF
jgi:hypothetical protein